MVVHVQGRPANDTIPDAGRLRVQSRRQVFAHREPPGQLCQRLPIQEGADDGRQSLFKTRKRGEIASTLPLERYPGCRRQDLAPWRRTSRSAGLWRRQTWRSAATGRDLAGGGNTRLAPSLGPNQPQPNQRLTSPGRWGKDDGSPGTGPRSGPNQPDRLRKRNQQLRQSLSRLTTDILHGYPGGFQRGTLRPAQ